MNNGRALFAFIHSSRPALITTITTTAITVVPPHCSRFCFVCIRVTVGPDYVNNTRSKANYNDDSVCTFRVEDG